MAQGKSMSWDFGLEGKGQMCKKKWRWLFRIEDVCAQGINALPPLRSQRPNIKWKESFVQHISETIYYPVKPEWEPVRVTLYDLQKENGLHPLFTWLKEIYMPKEGILYEPNRGQFIKEATLELHDGCGTVVETWRFEDAWPQSMDFQDLDMGSSEILLCEVTLRYARAYIEEPESKTQTQDESYKSNSGSSTYNVQYA